MKGKYKAAIALVLVLVLLPLTLLLTLTHWVPTLAGIWLPVGTRISLREPASDAVGSADPRPALSGGRL